MNIINDMLVDKCFPDNVNARTVVPAYKDKTASGNPITLTDSAENKPLGMTLYGWSKQDGDPSPDNPVEIESAGMKWSTGAQLFDASKLDGMSLYGVTLHIKDGIIYAEGEATENAWITVNLTKDEIQRLFEDGKYTITQQKFGNVNFDAGLYFGFIPSTFRNGTIELTIPESIKDGDVYYFINITKGVKHNGGIRVILNKGDTALPYEPYTGGIPKPYGDKVGVSVRGKNIFNFKKEDVIYKYIPDSLRIPGGILDINKGVSSATIWLIVTELKNLDNQKMILSAKADRKLRITYIFTDTNNTVLSSFNYSGATTERRIPLTVPQNAAKLYVNIFDVLPDEVTIQLEIGTVPTAYEPYHEPQSTSIVTPNGLPGIPVPSNTAGITYTDANGQAWIDDEIDLERGKYVQRVWQAEFDGSEDEAWAVSGTTFYSPSLPTNMKFRDGVTNKYAVRNVQNIQCVNFGRGNTALCVANPSEYDGSLDDKGLSNFKSHLAANPLVVMTYLDTPIERDLTSAELAEYTQLYSYKPTTVVENDSDCWMDVTYKAGTSGKSKNEALRWYFKNVMPLVG